MKVLKFGGTSVATPERRARVAWLVGGAAAAGPVVVVTSAVAGVTDLLAESIERALSRGETRDLESRLQTLHAEEGLTSEARREVARRIFEWRELIGGVALLGECPPPVRHRILALGERLASPLVVAALRRTGVRAWPADAGELLVTSPADKTGEPMVDLEASRRRLSEHRIAREGRANGNEVAVVTGFVAADEDGRTTTLGRGASDLSATLLAALLEAEEVEIWSDVDGVLSAPPSLVPEAAPIERLNYGEAAALAHFGARVLHPHTLAPIAGAGIPVRIRNTSRPAVTGTRIDGASRTAGPRAVAAVRGVSQITVRGAWNMPRLTSRVFTVLDDLGLRPLLSNRSEAHSSLSLALPEAVAPRLERELERTFGERGEVEVERRDATAALALLGGPAAGGGELWRELERQTVEPLMAGFCGDPKSAEVTAALIDDADCPRAVRWLHSSLIAPRQGWLCAAEVDSGESFALMGLPAPAPRRGRRPRRLELARAR